MQYLTQRGILERVALSRLVPVAIHGDEGMGNVQI